MSKRITILLACLLAAVLIAPAARPAAAVDRCLLTYNAYLPGALGTEDGPDATPQRGAAGKLQADFNGDGCADLAVGAPYSDVFGTNRAGMVEIFYGSRGGLANEGQIVLPPVPEDESFFGLSLAAGDFNNDGYSDLVVSAIGYLVSGQDDAGAIYVFPGSPQGIDPDNWTEWHQATPGVPGGPENGDLFGRALATGDFDGDNHSDLAIGIPNEAIGSVSRAGYVIVLYGSPSGLTADGAQEWNQASPGIDAENEVNDEFGWALAAGDFGPNSRYDDLAITVPSQDVGFGEDAGVVYVLYGSSNGLTSVNTTLLSQSTFGVSGSSEDFDKFGVSVAAGDFDDNGVDDLAVGIPFEDLSGESASGRVVVFYGERGDELSGSRSEGFDNGVAGANEADDYFGYSLATGDLDGDRHMDLIIGAPKEDIGSLENAGWVVILYGSDDGLDDATAQGWSYPASAEREGDWMGRSVTAGDYNGDGIWDMATGVDLRYDDTNSNYFRGRALVFYGRFVIGLTGAGIQELSSAPASNTLVPFRFGWAVR